MEINYNLSIGGLYENAIYLDTFKDHHSTYNYYFNKKNKRLLMELSRVDDLIKDLKPDKVLQYQGNHIQSSQYIDRFPEVKDIKEKTYTLVFIYLEKNFIINFVFSDSFTEDSLVFHYDRSLYSDISYFKELAEKIESYLYFADDSPKESILKLIYYDNTKGFQIVKSKIKSPQINLSENYNDGIDIVYNKLTEFIKSRNTGICFLRGEPGTGKSYFLRYLMKECPGNYILVPNSISSHLSSPEFLNFMIDNKDSIFILEDCEQVLFNRELNPGNTGVSGILNIADGLMSDVLNIKFICTFNTDINNIDKALLREGRCILNYEFTPLSVEKTEYLLNKLGKEVENCCEMTLAEIYNYKEKVESKTKSKKVGF